MALSQFYKYVTLRTGLMVLSRRTLRWSTPSMLNDPFDMQFAFQLPEEMNAVKTAAIEKAYRHAHGEFLDKPLNDFGMLLRTLSPVLRSWPKAKFDEMVESGIDESLEAAKNMMNRFNNRIVRDGLARSKVLCLSDFAASILMWSYYAGNHSGLVLRFNSEIAGSQFKAAKVVRYVDQMPPLWDVDSLSEFLSGYGKIESDRVVDEVVWTKSSHWKHEREWRIYAGNGRSEAAFEDIPFVPEELDGIILGMRMSDEHRQEIASLAMSTYPHVELLQAVPKQDAYELVFTAT